MGTVYRKTYTKPLPANADVVERGGQQLARWRPARGRVRTAPITAGQDGSPRVVVRARTYTAKYRDGSGIVREAATGCRDETAARAVLADLEKRAELVKAKVMTAEQDAVADHQDALLSEHFAAYIAHLRARGNSPRRIGMVRRRLERVAVDLEMTRLGDLRASKLEAWACGSAR